MSEKISKQLKYYHANKDEINEKNRNSKTICECGSSIPKSKEKRHYDTKKHKNFIESRELFYSQFESETSENNTENNTKK
jgi:hypothetical protein